MLLTAFRRSTTEYECQNLFKQYILIPLSKNVQETQYAQRDLGPF